MAYFIQIKFFHEITITIFPYTRNNQVTIEIRKEKIHKTQGNFFKLNFIPSIQKRMPFH
jgi:hypothetical protein